MKENKSSNVLTLIYRNGQLRDFKTVNSTQMNFSVTKTLRTLILLQAEYSKFYNNYVLQCLTVEILKLPLESSQTSVPSYTKNCF